MFDFPEKGEKRNRNTFVLILYGGIQVQFLVKLCHGLKGCLVIVYVTPTLIKLQSRALLLFHHSHKLYIQRRPDYLLIAAGLLTQRNFNSS